MTAQEAFTKCVTGLAAQEWVRSVQYGTCLYRGPKGLKCAVGQLIPDNVYDWHWDTNDGIASNTLKVIADTINAPINILRSMQVLHDSNHTPREMRLEFQRFAKIMGLEWPGGL